MASKRKKNQKEDTKNLRICAISCESLMSRIFSYLDVKLKLRLSQASKAWHESLKVSTSWGVLNLLPVPCCFAKYPAVGKATCLYYEVTVSDRETLLERLSNLENLEEFEICFEFSETWHEFFDTYTVMKALQAVKTSKMRHLLLDTTGFAVGTADLRRLAEILIGCSALQSLSLTVSLMMPFGGTHDTLWEAIGALLSLNRLEIRVESWTPGLAIMENIQLSQLARCVAMEFLSMRLPSHAFEIQGDRNLDKALRNMPCLKQLELELYGNLTENLFQYLATIFDNSKLHALEELSLAFPAVNDDDLWVVNEWNVFLGSMTASNLPKLKELRFLIHNTNVERSCYANFGAMLVSLPIQVLVLDLKKSVWRNASLEALLMSIGSMRQLTDLELQLQDNNLLSDASSEAWMTLASLENLESFKINISQCIDLRSYSLMKLFKATARCAKLHTLHLTMTKVAVAPQASSALANAIRGLSKLQDVLLSMTSCCLTDESAKSLAKALRVAPALCCLEMHMEDNMIHVSGAKSLLNALRATPRLKIFRWKMFEGNDFSEGDVEAVSKITAKMQAFKQYEVE